MVDEILEILNRAILIIRDESGFVDPTFSHLCVMHTRVHPLTLSFANALDQEKSCSGGYRDWIRHWSFQLIPQDYHPVFL
jgi:hypothetical protein